MKSVVGTIAVCALALTAVACDDGDEQVVTEPSSTTSTAPREGGAPPEGLGLSVAWDPDPLVSGAAATFMVTISNLGSEAIEITYSDGQRADVALLADGEEAYRWSDGQAFTQALARVSLGPGEVLEVPLEAPDVPLEPGTYDLVATTPGDPAPPPVETPIVVEALGTGGT